MKQDSSKLDKRARRVLHSLVLRYLQAGQPVGSRTLSNAAGLDCSPATIRNVMADLEELGLLVSPHTSAGRIPSASGIRFFVDQLLTVSPPTKKIVDSLRTGMRGGTTADVLRASAQVISQLTAYAGFVAVPSKESPLIKKVRFVKLSTSRILVVLMTAGGDVINRVIIYDRDVSESALNTAARLYNRYLSGMTLVDAKERLRLQLLELREQIAGLLRGLLEQIGDSAETAGGGLEVAGELNLLQQDDLSADVIKLRRLYDLLARKKELWRLLERGNEAENVRLFIGSECGVDALDECSVVFASHHGNGNGDSDGGNDSDRPLGIIGVIGPKRMRYSYIIPTVDVAARVLNSLLDDLRVSS